MSIVEIVSQPWPWYVSGPLISFVLFLLLWVGKRFGVSSSLESICTIAGAGKVSEYFRVDWKNNDWLLVFVLGSVIGGFLASSLFANPNPIDLSPQTISDLSALGLEYDAKFIPETIFNWNYLFSLPGFVMMIIGGIAIGFGTRYAGGCTSGHAISGLANLQLPSLVATIGFFIGGLVTTHLLLPFILNL